MDRSNNYPVISVILTGIQIREIVHHKIRESIATLVTPQYRHDSGAF